MDITRVTRKYVDVHLVATLSTGVPATVGQVDVALLPMRGRPTDGTQWYPTDVSGNTARFMIAGPGADPTSAVVAQLGRSDLWVRVRDTPEVDAAFIETINVH